MVFFCGVLLDVFVAFHLVFLWRFAWCFFEILLFDSCSRTRFNLDYS